MITDQRTDQRPAADGIDWAQVKQRLARAEQALTASGELSPERAKQVMDHRARLLAQPPDQAPNTSEILEVVTFVAGSEWHAIETRFIRAVVRPGKMTLVPGGPDFLIGLTNLRGEVLAVMDLRRFLKLPASSPGPQSQVLVMGVEQEEFGGLADAIEEVIQIRLDQIMPPPSSVPQVAREFLHGVTAEGLLVLDGDILLNDARLYVDEAD